MKITKWYIIGVGMAVLVCFGLWGVFLKHEPIGAADSSVPKTKASTLERVAETVQDVKEEIQLRANRGAFEKALQKEIVSLNQSMDFYGKVLDHLGRGIADATIVYTWDVQQAAPWVPTKTGSDRVQSKADGTFEFHLEAVRWITIYKITCNGYERPHGGDRVGKDYSKEVDASFYNSDPKKPELFYLTRKAEIAPLYCNTDDYLGVTSNRIEIHIDGTPIRIDIRTAKPDSKGELEVAMNVRKEDDSWTAKVRIPDGGIQSPRPSQQQGRTSEEPPTAPIDGYLDEIEITNLLTNPRGLGVYFRTREGAYGFLKGQLNANSRGGGLYLNVLFNPSPGNRLLHFDPDKRIK